MYRSSRSRLLLITALLLALSVPIVQSCWVAAAAFASSGQHTAQVGKVTATPIRTPHLTGTPRPTLTPRASVAPRATIAPTFTATPIPQILKVTTTADVVPCPKGAGNPGYSLRCAMGQANSIGSGRTIIFNIPSTDPGCRMTQFGTTSVPVCTITVTRTLNLTASDTTIDGYTQAGALANTHPMTQSGDSAVLTVRIDGSKTFAAGIVLSNANNDVIRGLSLTSFQNGPAISASQTNDTVFAGNFIGVAPDGAVQGNSEGIRLSQVHNITIGGLDPAARNRVSGNSGFGVAVSQFASGVTLQGNLISDNGGAGVGIGADAQGSVIPAVIRQNLIFGNTGLGIDEAPGRLSNCRVFLTLPAHSVPCPVIRSVTSKTVSGKACKRCTVDLYVASAETDDGGFGEGKSYLGSVVATNGKWRLPLSGKRFDPKRQKITATSTTSGTTPSTSEFALNMPVDLRFAHKQAILLMSRNRLVGVKVSWQMSDQTGIAGFDVYAGSHHLNARLVKPTPALKYTLKARLKQKATVVLVVLLENGLKIKVPVPTS